jgi:hypothetical protein
MCVTQPAETWNILRCRNTSHKAATLPCLFRRLSQRLSSTFATPKLKWDVHVRVARSFCPWRGERPTRSLVAWRGCRARSRFQGPKSRRCRRHQTADHQTPSSSQRACEQGGEAPVSGRPAEAMPKSKARSINGLMEECRQWRQALRLQSAQAACPLLLIAFEGANFSTFCEKNWLARLR